MKKISRAYSGGFSASDKRVIARAAVWAHLVIIAPAIVLADEPTANLDAAGETGEEILLLMKKINRSTENGRLSFVRRHDKRVAIVPRLTRWSASSPRRVAGFRGFIQNVMAYDWPKPQHWSEMMTRADVSAQGDFSSNVKWKLGVRVDYDATYTFTDFYPQAVADNQRFNILLRENYLDISAGDWDFRLGRQQIVWGEMVGLLFGDVVSAKDMRQFILPEFEILRIPQWAARAEYFKDDFHAELIWIPIASYDNIGKPGSEFYVYTLPPPPGFGTSFRNEKIPTRSLANTNYGLRLSVLKDGWDVAAFAYSSMSVAPTFYREIVAGPQPTVVYQARHDRIQQFGSTLAKDFGSVVLKAEAVYTRGLNYQVTDPGDADGVVPQNTLTWVLGLDFTEFADTRINTQIFQSHFFNHNPDIIQSTNEYGYSLLVNHKFSDKVRGGSAVDCQPESYRLDAAPACDLEPGEELAPRAGCGYFQRLATGVFRALRRQGPRLFGAALQLLKPRGGFPFSPLAGDENCRAAYLTCPQLLQGLIRGRQRKTCHFGPDTGPRRDGEELLAIAAGEVGDRAHAAFPPEDLVGEFGNVAHVNACANHRSALGGVAKRLRNQFPGRREENRRVHFLRRGHVGAARPGRPLPACKLLAVSVSRAW
jgi:hypothetical protein